MHSVVASRNSEKCVIVTNIILRDAINKKEILFCQVLFLHEYNYIYKYSNI